MQYIAVIGDIKASKRLNDRRQSQEKLTQVLEDINKEYVNEIAAEFLITLGDEFQGLLRDGRHLVEMMKFLQKQMYPVRLRFGVGVGEISTNIIQNAAIGADGPAYYAARSMIEEVRLQEKRLKEQATDILLSVYGFSCVEIREINMMLVMMKVIEDSWTDNQRFTIWNMMEYGGSQKECAERMSTTQSTVARRLANGKYIIYENAKKTIEEAVIRLGELYNDK